tara:strand:+ start:61983 stop:63107 length:1125 start_codon:yes stop_codon:yes gene_type:complete
MSVTPAQWLPDPQSLEHQRYWDGEQWTEQVRDNPPVFEFDDGIDFFSQSTPFRPAPPAPPRAPIIRLAPSTLLDSEPTPPAPPAPVAPPTSKPESTPIDQPAVAALPSFFDTPVEVAPVMLNFEKVPERPEVLAAAAAAEPAPEDRVLKEKVKRPRPGGPTASTWIVGVFLLLSMSILGPANPQAATYVLGSALLSTALIALISGRPGWAKIGGRLRALVPLVIAVALIAGAPMLPTSIVVAPKLLTAPPTPSSEQQQIIYGAWTSIEPRFESEWEPAKVIEFSARVCINDFSSQTPDQEVGAIMSEATFPSEPHTVTAEQAQRMLNAVRTEFCGQPGVRDVSSEVIWSVNGLVSAAGDLLNTPQILGLLPDWP